ncbi:39S ribosomal protein L40, mitochondrial [Trichoplax sp. H2]|uniref:Large ribosomal subunit protein mL40 n=1 Tax=Trichoplax adhaerens TaxID=10228 RepID=B3S0G1_TRIAD|nr:hypothetical protein TRIADDRAFT_57036 [Trichoplax adhaerens]EDV24008.1 hypothetical protein TRIADDRAFT_57036 [Trichoplax adhaerens]RDD44875.1 39S ribosomal protein L40, mitochondrial [Trichoplax sp. H2]|eukprot:XP_002113534.1 hypothetical protein TRIADDRAFT_57036 [Trichoplax adhaerens]
MAAITRAMSVFGLRSTALSVRYVIPIRGDGKKKKKSKVKNKLTQQQQQKAKLNSKLAKAAQQEQEEAKKRKKFVDPPVDSKWLKEDRKRNIQNNNPEEEERRILLLKEWSRYKMNQHRSDLIKFQDIYKSRNQALLQLKVLSPSLYAKALQADPQLFPYQCNGPTFTPPIAGYDQPEAEVTTK